jgi:hypothetical protein
MSESFRKSLNILRQQLISVIHTVVDVAYLIEGYTLEVEGVGVLCKSIPDC